MTGPVPKCAVVMSTYNDAQFLPLAVGSVLRQTFDDFEFIIVDDGSEDDTNRVLAEFEHDVRVRVVHKEHTGLADSLNVGIREARGQWIARIDANDIAEPERLERQLARAEEDPNTVLVGSGCTLIDEAGVALRTYRYPEEHGALVAMWEQGGSPFPHSSALCRRSAVLNVGLYNERFQRAQDLDLWFRLSQVGTVTSLTSPLVRLRKQERGLSGQVDIDTGAFGVAPRACHHRRRRGLADPSRGSETEWCAFLSAARETVVRTGLVDSLQARAFLRKELQAVRGGRFGATMRLTRALARRPRLAAGLLAARRYRASIRILASWDGEVSA